MREVAIAPKFIKQSAGCITRLNQETADETVNNMCIAIWGEREREQEKRGTRQNLITFRKR